MLLLLWTAPARGQQAADFISVTGGLDTLYVADYEAESFVGPTNAARKSGEVATATIEVTYNGFSAQARQAFEFAATLWETHVDSPVTIRIQANWQALGENVLGAAGPRTVFANYTSFPSQETWYAAALAEALEGENLTGNEPDIVATFNSEFDNWYFGTDGNTPRGQYDLVTVVLHEIGHGLGFTGTFDYDDGIENADDGNRDECPSVGAGFGCWGISTGDINFPLIYDRFAEDTGEVALLNTSVYPNPSTTLGSALRSDALFFDGPVTRSVYGDAPVDLYAPSNFEPGSSFSHLDEEAFPSGDPNSLMTPQLARSEAIFSPGAVTCAIFKDTGWTLGPDCSVLVGETVFPADASVSQFEVVRNGSGATLLWDVSDPVLDGRDFDRFEVQVRDLDADLRDDFRVSPDTGFVTVETIDNTGGPQFQTDVSSLDPGRYEFRLRSVFNDGGVVFDEGGDTVLILLGEDALVTPVYPNPFSTNADVVVQVKQRQVVVATLYDITGRLVAVLLNEEIDGSRGARITLDATGLASGVYFVRVEGETFAEMRRAVVVQEP